METKTLFRRVKDAIKQGRSVEALGLLRDALRRGSLDAEEVDRAGRLVREALAVEAGSGEELPRLRIRLLGQFTTSWLKTTLTAVAWERNVRALVDEGGYDNIVQDLAADRVGGGERPDLVVLLPWNRRLLGGEETAADRVEAELASWRQAWGFVRRQGSRLLQVGYDWMIPGALGHHLGGRPGGPVDLVRRMNAALREELPEDAYFLDLEQVSGMMGRQDFYDPRRYYWTKQPFSERGTLHLARHLWGGVQALTTGPKKVLVVDLDNTLWGGVVGETGPHGIALGDSADGEAFRDLQGHLKDLSRRGVLLAVASKNNPADAREPFELNPDMRLGLDDFAAFEACWDPKADSILRIARTLNLGLDSFVFLDDNPAERELIRLALPEVEVLEVGDDPADYARALQSGLYFEAVALTGEDRARVDQYAVERRRRELQETAPSLEDYLRSLEMQGAVREVDEADLQRVVQLLDKTNQFNLTTRRHSREDVLGLMGQPRSIALTLRMNDRFGDHGLVALMIGVGESGRPDAIRIDTWLMSCRVIGRTAEHFFLGQFLDRARALGYRSVVGEYLPTKKNGQVAGLYETLGFARISGSGVAGGASRFAAELGDARPTTFVLPVEAVDATGHRGGR